MVIRRSRLLGLMLGAFFATAVTAVAEGPRQRPNILFIFADDHSPRTVSCYPGAYEMACTPNIDRLAASGIRFRTAYFGSWCMPSRASLLTGLHPHAIESMRMEGPYPGSTYDPQRCRFWPSVFRQHGYQTAQIGKWHTGTDAGYGRDWDHQRVWNRPAEPKNAGNYYGPQWIETNGTREWVEGYATDRYTEWACDYIRGGNRLAEKPWYLWVCYGGVHRPTIPAARHRERLRQQTAQLPADIVGPRPGKPAYLEATQAWELRADGAAAWRRGEKTHTQWLQQTMECLAAVDEGVGKLLAALAETGQLEQTLVVYSSDQGFANGEHGLLQKVAPYDAAYASPLIVSRPGTLPAGRVCQHSVNAADLVVTFFAQAGIPLPWKMHGRDFSQLLRNPDDASWDHPTLYEHTGQHYGVDVAAAVSRGDAVHQRVPYYAAVCQHQLKYIRYFGADLPEELYDLGDDPHELCNVVDDPRYADQLRALRTAWMVELQATDAPFFSQLRAGRD
jgi:arylsulfatase A-like enzyme